MLDLSTCLKYYSRQEIQKELVSNAGNRELGVRYLNGGFGKRPDLLQNNADVLEFAKQGVTSFHISEEHWSNPLSLSPSLKKQDVAKLRIGWDLIIDIDCPDWELSKRIAFVVVKVLKNHGINSISCKFSGNKGFHIGVPLKSFPKTVQGKGIDTLFPDFVKRIIDYVVYYAGENFSNEILGGLDVKKLCKKLDLKESDILHEICAKCKRKYSNKAKVNYYICDKCGTNIKTDKIEEFLSCPKCKSIVKIMRAENTKQCKYCKSKSIIKEINIGNILGLDQILIAPRHLYRMAYSLHEKSGLASLPINPFSVLAFDKALAKPANVKVKYHFLEYDKTVPGEAGDLMLKSIDFEPKVEEEEWDKKPVYVGDFEDQEKVPVELFPPCILKLSQGVKDGRKRALFILVNFLTSVGWDYPDVENYIHEWNKKNDEQLRETVIKGQIGYHKTQKKQVLPPNCDNKMYYQDIGICCPDDLCSRVKNPVNYSKKRAYFLNNQNKRKKKPKKDEKKKGNSKKTDSKDQNKKADQKRESNSSTESTM